jgi:hypothetical protein
MLPRKFGPSYNHYPCYIQPKLNGVRALYQCGIFQSSDEQLWRAGVLGHLVEALEPTRNVIGNTIFDGVLYVHGWSKQRIEAAVKIGALEPERDTLVVQYHVFDIVNAKLHFSERWILNCEIMQLEDDPFIRAVPTAKIWFPEEVEQQFKLWTDLGYDGVVLRPGGPYEFSEPQSGSSSRYRSKYLWEHTHELNKTK